MNPNPNRNPNLNPNPNSKAERATLKAELSSLGKRHHKSSTELRQLKKITIDAEAYVKTEVEEHKTERYRYGKERKRLLEERDMALRKVEETEAYGRRLEVKVESCELLSARLEAELKEVNAREREY